MKLSIQYIVLLIVGSLLGLLGLSNLPDKVAPELLKALSNVVAISSSILGFSISWMSQSKSLIKGISYDAASHLFEQISNLQNRMLWRWGLSLGSSFAAIIATAFLADTQSPRPWVIPTAFAFLCPALCFVLILFAQMIQVSKLKHKLELHEREELRKANNTPSSSNPAPPPKNS